MAWRRRVANPLGRDHSADCAIGGLAGLAGLGLVLNGVGTISRWLTVGDAPSIWGVVGFVIGLGTLWDVVRRWDELGGPA